MLIKMFKTLEVYMGDLEHRIFNKYEIGVDTTVRHKIKGNEIAKIMNNSYHMVVVYDDAGKKYAVSVARAMISTFLSPPPTKEHTVDHKNRIRTDNRVDNLRWCSNIEQRDNQSRPAVHNDAFLIVHDGEEKTAKEWACEKNQHSSTICLNAQKGVIWKYKEYEDFPGEEWKLVENSHNCQGFQQVSNLGRYAIHKKYARKVFFPNELRLSGGYPNIKVGGKDVHLHIAVFKTFKTSEYKDRNKEEYILHKNDDIFDCSIDNLHLGSRSKNGHDAHDNGRHDGTKTRRKSCVGYKDGNRYDFKSVREASRWIQTNVNNVANHNSIINCIKKRQNSAYGFIWEYTH